MKCGSLRQVATFSDVFEAIHRLGTELWKAASSGTVLSKEDRGGAAGAVHLDGGWCPCGLA